MADERERQTSNKAGLRSLGKKLDGSRYGFDEHPASRKTAGAFGREQVRGAEDEPSNEERTANSDPSTGSGSPRAKSRGEERSAESDER